MELNYYCTFEFDGSSFEGFQKQPHKLTIQGEIERVFGLLSLSPITFVGCSRTDKGVHALNYSANVKLDSRYLDDIEHLKYSFNRLIDRHIFLKHITEVPSDFHARFSASYKTYMFILNDHEYSPFLVNYAYQLHYELDDNRILRALNLFKGKHYFKNFCSNDEDDKGFMRTIFEATVSRNSQGLLVISLTGDGFKRYMVRFIIGAILEYESGKISLEDIQKLLEDKETEHQKLKVPAAGLYLMSVYYPEDSFLC